MLAVAIAALLPLSTARAEVRTLAIVPYYAPEKIWILFSPFVEHLSRATGIPWKLRLYPDQEALVEGIGRGEVSVAFLGPVPFGRVSRKTPLRPLLVAKAADGSPWYRSVLVTADPSVRRLGDVRGKAFGFFEGSTAAHVVPRRMLEDAGISPGSYRPVFLKGQDRIVDALLRREIAAAGIKLSLYEKFRGTGMVALLRSEPLPNFCFCATPALAPPDERRFVKALLSLRTGPGEADHDRVRAWDDEIRNGFVPPPRGYRETADRLASDYESFAGR